MKSKILPMMLTLLALSTTVPIGAYPEWYLEFQCEITGFELVGPDPEGRGLLFDVSFVGVAGGPNVKEGTVGGVDHLLLDWLGIGHLDVYLTITDNEGDTISAYIVGLSIHKNPGKIAFEGTQATIIDELDYPTSDKYADMVGATFRSEGFISGLSTDPPRGRIHGKWYYAQAQPFTYDVWMPTGEAASSLEWLESAYPVHWWGDLDRPPFPVDEYPMDNAYICHGDWLAGCPAKEGNFRYRWWIYWKSEEAAGQPGAKSLGGCFIFSQGTGDFGGMSAFGTAWVEMLPGEVFPVGYQYHEGIMLDGP